MSTEPSSPPAELSRASSDAPEAVAWSADDLRHDPHAAPDKAQRVQRMFAAIARRYDLNNRLHSFGRDQAWRRRAVQLCELRPTDTVLDVACGTGDLALAFARAGAASVTGLDFTPEMLEIARAKAHAAGHSVDFVQGDAMDLPFPDASFDVVSIAFGIRNVAEPIQALREFHRVLKTGGRLVVLEFTQPRNAPLRWLNRIYTERVMPITATLIARDRSGAYKYLPRSVATFPEPEEFVSRMRACGFSDVKVQAMTFGVCAAYVARR